MFGIPLAPGERVIYYRRIPKGPIGTIITGIILLPFFLVGILLFIQAAKMRKAESYANVITNRRLFTVNAFGKVLEQLAWTDVTGVTYYRVRRGRDHVDVRGRNNQKVAFYDWVNEVHEFIERTTGNIRAIDSFPEPFFDPAPPPAPKAGRAALVWGLVMAGLGALTILFALVAVQESEALWVAAVGALGVLAGGILAAIGASRAKAQ